MNKKQLLGKINNLGPTEHNEIYKLLQANGVSYTENKNGVFFNLSSVSEQVLDKLEDFVNYCYQNISELEDYNKKLNECKFRNNIERIIPNVLVTSSINEPISKKERVKELLELTDKEHIIRDFVEKLNTNIDKVTVKKVGTKFTLAKKRFAKRIVPEVDLRDELDLEVL